MIVRHSIICTPTLVDGGANMKTGHLLNSDLPEHMSGEPIIRGRDRHTECVSTRSLSITTQESLRYQVPAWPQTLSQALRMHRAFLQMGIGCGSHTSAQSREWMFGMAIIASYSLVL